MMIELNETEIAQVLVDWLNERRLVRPGMPCDVNFQKRDDGKLYAILTPLTAPPVVAQPEPPVGGMISRQTLKDMAMAGEVE